MNGRVRCALRAARKRSGEQRYPGVPSGVDGRLLPVHTFV